MQLTKREEKVNRILLESLENGLIDSSDLVGITPEELGKSIREALEANPPTLKERVWIQLYAFRLKLKRGK